MYYNLGNKLFLMTESDFQNPTPLPSSQKEKGFFRELIEFALLALLVVVPFRIFIAQPYIVNGASMNPTFKGGEYLIVDQVSYRLGEPERGSVLIFRYPKDPSWYFIKRVIGLPGETVEIRNGDVWIKNDTSPEGFALREEYVEFEKKENVSVTLSAEEYFVLGDNRLGSADSRLWGPVPRDNIVGRPVLRLFPLNRLSIFPGNNVEQATN
jgi:signal peptidase I